MFITAKLPSEYGDFVNLKKANYPFIRFYMLYLEKIAYISNKNKLDVISCIGMLENKFNLSEINHHKHDKHVFINYQTDNESIIDMYSKVPFMNKQITLLLTILLLKLTYKFGYSMSGILYQLDMLNDNKTVVLDDAVKTDDNTENIITNETIIKTKVLDDDIKNEDKDVKKPKIARKKTNIKGESLIGSKTVKTNPLLDSFY